MEDMTMAARDAKDKGDTTTMKTTSSEPTATNNTTNKRTYTRLAFSLEQEEELIEFVKENAALYDPKDMQYKNKNYRDSLWNEFGKKTIKQVKYLLAFFI